MSYAERKFINEVGNEILAVVALGERPENYCRLCLYGPDSAIESYTTRMELEQLRDALNEVLPPQSGEATGNAEPAPVPQQPRDEQ